MSNTEVEITLPYNGWRPRPYQLKAWSAFENGVKRIVLAWHRRSGKDELCLHWAATAMFEKPATYWHMLPLKDQARTAIWESINPHTGIRRIDEAFPDALFDKRETDMMIKCKTNSSTWQVKGSDNYGAGIGSPPYGIIFSEYAMSNPSAWAYLQPILEENGGWAAFISTTRGRNHFHGLFELAKTEPGWFAQLLTNDETKVFSDEQMASIERVLASERGTVEAQALVAQEYYCSWDAAIPGAYYGSILEAMERADPTRITHVPYDPGFMVETWWDLGISDDNAIWFTQKIGREHRIIDYYESSGQGIDHYANVLNQRGYNYAPIPCVLPHDAGHGQLSQRGGSSLAQVLARDYGLKNRINPPCKSLVYSINQVKSFLPTCVFDAVNCKQGLDKLRQYRRNWNDKHKRYDDRPLHDWTSHAADAFRTGVEGYKGNIREPEIPSSRPFHVGGNVRQRFAITDSDPLGR